MRIFKILATLAFVLSLSAPSFAQSSAAGGASGSAGAAGATAAASGGAGAAAAVSTTVAVAAAAVAAVVVAYNQVAQLKQKQKIDIQGACYILSLFY